MSEIVPLNARSLAYRSLGQRCTLDFDEEYLTCSFHDHPALTITKTPLWRIMPELLVDRSLAPSFRSCGSVVRYSLAGGVIVWFSDIRPHVPLLAPVLFLCAAHSLYLIFRGAFPLEKTKVVSEWGEEIAVIPHHEEIATRRKSFEEALLRAVREARRKHDEA